MDCGLICKIFIVFFILYVIFISTDFFGYKKPKVVSENFKSRVNEGKRDVFVLYYADWCGHCQAMKPNWYKAKKALKTSAPNVVCKEVNAGEDSEIAAKENIEGFPTVMLKCKNGETKEYSGDRSAPDLEKFCMENV